MSSADATRAPGCDVEHLLSAVRSQMTRGSETGDPGEKALRVTLEERELWRRFGKLTNEMIVTKTGRRMFPVLTASVAGLDPSAMYSVLLDFVPVGAHRWKYVNGEWVAGGGPDSPPPPGAAYVHPDSPNFGAHWMGQRVAFSKVKLSNKLNGAGQIMLNSLHKYEPRIHVMRVGGPEKQRLLRSFRFPETHFIAVTAYQNEDITQLKIKFNPFAKAFLDIKEKGEHEPEDYHGHQQPRYPQLGGWFLPTAAGPLRPPSPRRQFPPSIAVPSPVNRGRAAERRGGLHPRRSTPYPPPPPYEQKYSPTSAYATDSAVSSLSLLPAHEAWSPLGSSAHHTPSSATGPSHQCGSLWPPPVNASSAVPPVPASSRCVAPPAPASLLRAAYANHSQPSAPSVPGVPRHAAPAGYQDFNGPTEVRGGYDSTGAIGSYPTVGSQLCPGTVGAWSPLTPPSPGV